MAMNNEKTLEVLNTLIEISNDRIEGYETASNETTEDDLKELFSRMIKTSTKCKQELIQEVIRLGGTPVDGTRISGKFFRTWMDVKVALARDDRKAILNSCEFGEDVALNTYEEALDNESEYLDEDQLNMIEDQFDLLEADHDEIKDLRDQLVVHS